MISRRGFLSMFGEASAALIVAPTLVETLLIGAKKYFFMSAPVAFNPLSETACMSLELERIRDSVYTQFSQDDAFLQSIRRPKQAFYKPIINPSSLYAFDGKTRMLVYRRRGWSTAHVAVNLNSSTSLTFAVTFAATKV